MYEEVNIDGCRILTPPGRKSPAGATQIKSDWFSWMLKKLIVREQKQDWWWRKAANLLAAEADKYILCDTKWNIRQHSCFSPRCRSRRSCAAPVEPTDARWRTARGWWSEDPWGSPNRPGHLGRRRWRLETDGEKEQLDHEEEQRKSRSRTRGVEQSFLSPSSDQKSAVSSALSLPASAAVWAPRQISFHWLTTISLTTNFKLHRAGVLQPEPEPPL